MKTGLEIAEEVINAINIDYENKASTKYYTLEEIKEILKEIHDNFDKRDLGK